MGSTDSLAALARPLLADAGLELWDIETGPSVLRILVDRPGGVDLDALSAATVALSPLLDDRQDLAPEGRYDLEVSSPGIERTLRTVEQYRRYVGSLLAVKTTVAVEGTRRFRATLVAVGDDAVDVMVDGSTTPVTVPLEHIDRARTVLEWGARPAREATGRAEAKPSKQKHPPKKQAHKQQSRANRNARPAEASTSGANDKDNGS